MKFDKFEIAYRDFIMEADDSTATDAPSASPQKLTLQRRTANTTTSTPASKPPAPRQLKTGLQKTLNRPNWLLRGIAAMGGYDMSHRDDFNITPNQLTNVLNLFTSANTEVLSLNTDEDVQNFIKAFNLDDSESAQEFEQRLDDLKSGSNTKPIFLHDPDTGKNIVVRRKGNDYQAFIKKSQNL